MRAFGRWRNRAGLPTPLCPASVVRTTRVRFVRPAYRPGAEGVGPASRDAPARHASNALSKIRCSESGNAPGVSPRSATPDHGFPASTKIGCGRSGRRAVGVPDVVHRIMASRHPPRSGAAGLGDAPSESQTWCTGSWFPDVGRDPVWQVWVTRGGEPGRGAPDRGFSTLGAIGAVGLGGARRGPKSGAPDRGFSTLGVIGCDGSGWRGGSPGAGCARSRSGATWSTLVTP